MATSTRKSGRGGKSRPPEVVDKEEQKDKFKKQFGEKLRLAREKRLLSREALSEKIGSIVTPATIEHYEHGVSLPDAFVLDRIAEVLGIDVNSLVRSGEERVKALTNPLKLAIDLLVRAEELGVVGFYPSRQAALQSFVERLEMEREEIIVVGSSIRGLRVAIPNLGEMFKEKLKEGVDIKIVLSSCFFSFLREPIELRAQGAIFNEIKEAWTILTSQLKFPKEKVRFFPGTPTVFLVSTPSRMILNPYPYGKEAYSSFCIEVELKATPDCIFRTYRREHFEEAWKNSVACDAQFFPQEEWVDAQQWMESGRKVLESMMAFAEKQRKENT